MDFNSTDMRKFIVFVTLICSSTFVDAQNNLVFNRVLNFSVPSSGVTVPEGKAWKIENGASNMWYKVVTTSVPYGDNLTDVDYNEHFQVGDTTDKPIWLAEGTILKSGNGANIPFVSILEFNVVPISSSGSGTVDTGISNGALPGDDYTPGDSFSDTDGNTYETVEINGQTWTTTNLNVSTYRDGTPIPYISDFDEWNASSIGAYTYAGQDSEAGYGKLYNAAAIIGRHDIDGATANKILAPEGFHIPTTTEWSNLIYNYTNPTIFLWVNGNGTANLNGYESDVASSFLKSQTSWDNNGNNESGLNLKNYPSIGSYVVNNNYNFYNVTDFGYTYFAVNQLVRYSVNEIWIQSVVVSDFTLDSVPAGCRNNGGNIGYTPGGLYVRLVKD